MPIWLEYFKDGGIITLMLGMGAMAVKIVKRLDRDESLRNDFPPHRHINGTRIVYPKEYQPSTIERIES